MKNLSPFHLAIPVDNLDKAINFYENILGFNPGRKSEHWVDYNFFGHQLVVHYDPSHKTKNHHNEVDAFEYCKGFNLVGSQNRHSKSQCRCEQR